MDYRIKRIFGALFVTALIIFVWALITGTAHAQSQPQSRASIFSTEQLFLGLPVAQARCLKETPDGPACSTTSAIVKELLARGVLKSARTLTIDKLRMIVIVNESCLRGRVCVNDPALLSYTLATMLIVNHIAPDDFARTYEQAYSQLHALGPTYAPVLDYVFMNVQRARADGL